MKRIRVLIVEDEPIIAADLEDRLIEMGYWVAQVCHSGEEALSFLQQYMVDLVLMDIQLGGQLDGIETATKIRESLTVPIIYLTSNTDESHFIRAQLTHPSAYLSKPYRGKDLKHAIELALIRISRFRSIGYNFKSSDINNMGRPGWKHSFRVGLTLLR